MEQQFTNFPHQNNSYPQYGQPNWRQGVPPHYPLQAHPPLYPAPPFTGEFFPHRPSRPPRGSFRHDRSKRSFDGQHRDERPYRQRDGGPNRGLLPPDALDDPWWPLLSERERELLGSVAPRQEAESNLTLDNNHHPSNQLMKSTENGTTLKNELETSALPVEDKQTEYKQELEGNESQAALPN